MGFTTGFTGGVTLTLSVAYLTVLAHQRHRQRQCDVLRANTSVLRALALSDPITAARLASPHAAAAAAETSADLSAAAAAQEFYYPSKPEPPRQPRTSFVEGLKTRWNMEIEGAVRKVQTTDWVEVRENAEGRLAHLWYQAFGGEDPAVAAAARASAAAAAVQERVASATETVQAKASEAAAAAKNVANRAVDKSREVLAVEADKAKATAAKASGKLSDVELALQQRYAGADDGRMKRSVGELLDERYKHTA
ncbi:hypothetical protein SEUCBS139899_008858 [Sporothrix eucalyptigena]|uniref:MICOS complex subunit MIC12 n=1 Tax=Sporothrix eucalyptigena TaxID=1812306 RepID=A0ABP0ARV6_9PEZI